MDLNGRTVLVLGLGETGLSMARWIAREGGTVRVADTRDAPPALAALRAALPQAEVDDRVVHAERSSTASIWWLRAPACRSPNRWCRRRSRAGSRSSATSSCSRASCAAHGGGARRDRDHRHQRQDHRHRAHRRDVPGRRASIARSPATSRRRCSTRWPRGWIRGGCPRSGCSSSRASSSRRPPRFAPMRRPCSTCPTTTSIATRAWPSMPPRRRGSSPAAACRS